MSGKKTNNFITLADLFALQQMNQDKMLTSGLYDGLKSTDTTSVPIDDPKLMSYHVQQLISEVGEVLEADKRWKNFRNRKYDKEGKLEEIADCFIVLMNIAMFSGFDADELAETITKKLDEVWDRLSAG